MAWRADCPHCRAEARDSTGPGTGIDPTTARRRLPRIAPDPTPTAPAGGAAGVGKRGGGGIAVFLDFTDFETRLGELASDAGVDAFTAGEVTQLQDGIQTGMETVYAEFTVSFSQADPGGTFETVRFGDTDPTPNLLGIADGFPDYRNINGNDVGHVFTANFFGSVNEFTGGEDREEQLRQLTVALYGTAAHELGHNLGLQHYDPYGSPLLRDPDDTGEAQNVHIMATGSTGLGEAARESPRTLSRLSKVKLEFSNGLTAAPQATTDEQVAGHGTPATAQALALADLPISGVRAANVLGAVAVADELDVYSFTAQAGQLITLNTMSDTQSLNLPGYADPVDTVLSLFDTDGTTLLASNDDIRYDFTTIGTGTTYYNQDSLIVNFTAPATGTYYAQVAGFDSSETGNYELLVSVGDPSPVNYDPDLNLVSVDGRDGEDDTVVLSRTGIALYVDWNGTRYTLFTNFEPVDEIEVATLGGDDLLRVDFSGGDSPIPDDGIGYDGGTNGATGDRLVVEQGAATALTHAFTGPASGSIGVDGAIVAYVNVEPAVTLDMTADELTFTLTGGGDDALLSDDATAGDGFSSLRGVAGGLSVIFSMPATSLTLNGGAGDDTLVLEGLDADYVGSGVAVALNGGADDDAFTLDWSGGVLDLPLTLAGGAGENTLEALGDGALDLTYRPDAATPGSGTLDLGATNLPAFSGMASLDLSGFDALKLITPGDADDLTLANPQAGMGTVSGSSGGVDFAPFSFRETASLALDAAANDAGGDDTVMLGTDLAPGFGGTVTLQQLIVLTGSGHDTVTAGLSPTTALDLDAGDPAGPASPGDVLVFEPRGLGALDAGGPPPADGSISAPGHMALAYQRFEELVTADSRSLKIQSLRYAVSFVKRALGLGENVDSFSASGVLNAADFAAQGIDTATFAGEQVTVDLQGASFALGAPLLANGRTTTWQLKNGTTYVRVTLSNATGRFSIAARNVDLDAGLAAAGADNLATYFNAPVELNLSLRIGTWGSRARLRTLYTLRTVGTTGTGRFRYGAPGFELPEGLLIATRMRIMQRSDKLGGFQQRAMADLALRLPQGQEPDPTAGGAALALADFTENVGDGSIPNLVFTGTGTSFSYRRGSKDGLGQPIPLTGVSSMSFNNRTWTVRALTHWLDDGVLGVAPVTDPLNDPAFVDVPVALTVNGVTLETLVRLTRLGRSSLYRR